MSTPTVDFASYRALSFDCYGTLIDWELGIRQSLQPWCAWHAIECPAEELLAEYARHESAVEAEHPTMAYPQVLGMSLRRLAGHFGATATDAECAEFGASVGAWPAFSDTADALRRLAQRFALIIVSNIDDASFAASARRLGVDFATVITAQQVGSYKPHLGHFTELHRRLDGLGIGRHELLHVAQSLFHDHVPAQSIGLPAVWIDRRAGRPGSGATPPVDLTVAHRYDSMKSFADAVDAGMK
jgi:2-haloacid dehalogenase